MNDKEKLDALINRINLLISHWESEGNNLNYGPSKIIYKDFAEQLKKIPEENSK